MWPILKVVVVTAACIGFGVQVVNVSRQYFAYATTIRVQQIRRPFIQPLNTFFCVPYDQVIWEKNQTARRRLTVTEILQLSPPNHRVIRSCRFRDKHARLRSQKGTACNEQHNHTKCYSGDNLLEDRTQGAQVHPGSIGDSCIPRYFLNIGHRVGEWVWQCSSHCKTHHCTWHPLLSTAAYCVHLGTLHP